jgi:hypothetical protein
MRRDLFRFSGDHILHAAVVIQRFRGGGDHTGIVYWGVDSGLRFLACHFDGSIRDEPWRGDLTYVIPNTDDDALANLASICRVTAERYREQPPQHRYAFRRSPSAGIDVGSGRLDVGDALGPTRASFVIIATASAGVGLVAGGEGWPHRPHVNNI